MNKQNKAETDSDTGNKLVVNRRGEGLGVWVK